MGEIDKLIDIAEYSEEEAPSIRQELINNIYWNFLDLPITVLDRNNQGDPISVGFGHKFNEGSTTPGFSDQISGKFNLTQNELAIFYAKGINAGRIVFNANPIDGNVSIKSFQVFRKDSHPKEIGGYSYSLATSPEGGARGKPHLHAVTSLIAEAKKKCESNIRNCSSVEKEEDNKNRSFRRKEILRIKSKKYKLEQKLKKCKK